MKKICIYILPLMLIAIACSSPKPIYQIEPIDLNTEWYLGKQVLIDSTNEAIVQLSFGYTDEVYCYYDLVYVNKSNDKIIANPSEFTQLITMLGTNSMYLERAADPQKLLSDLEVKRRSELAAVQNDRTANFALFLVGTALAVATESPAETYVDLADDLVVNSEIAEDNHRYNMSAIDERKRFIKQSAFDKTTLFPAQFLDGWIAFPFRRNAAYYQIIIPAGSDNLKFTFKQTAIDVEEYAEYLNSKVGNDSQK